MRQSVALPIFQNRISVAYEKAQGSTQQNKQRYK